MDNETIVDLREEDKQLQENDQPKLSKEAQLLIDAGGELNGCEDVIRFRTTYSMYRFEYKMHSDLLTIDTSECDYTPSHRIEIMLYPISGVTFIESLKAIATYLTGVKSMIANSVYYNEYDLMYIEPKELYDIAMRQLTTVELDCLVNMLNNVVTGYSK